jgi:hypothetical protein
MSDMHDMPGMANEQVSPSAQKQTLSEEYPKEQMETIQKEIAELEASIDEQSYALGEVPQVHLFDPEANLALNSEKLSAVPNRIESLVQEVEGIISQELQQVTKLQKNIDHWEAKIEKNKALIEKNKVRAKKNKTEIVYDIKNRDYWLARQEQVLIDFGHASVANRDDHWAWLIKKYGLKNPDGTPIDPKNTCVDELCNGGASNLAAEYKSAGQRYELAKKDREEENYRLTMENSKFKTTIETLQRYIQSAYHDQIEPIQDGVLLMKELAAKLRDYQNDQSITFGDLRHWSEEFLSEYLLENPNTSQEIVTDFRKIASIPLPAEHS